MTKSDHELIKLAKPGIYRHFRGSIYQLIQVARHSETEQWHVFYRCLYGDYSYWIRPLDEFFATVALGNESVRRFSFLTSKEQWERDHGPLADLSAE